MPFKSLMNDASLSLFHWVVLFWRKTSLTDGKEAKLGYCFCVRLVGSKFAEFLLFANLDSASPRLLMEERKQESTPATRRRIRLLVVNMSHFCEPLKFFFKKITFSASP